MKSSNLFSRLAVVSTLAFTGLCANAALYDRGNGMIYDSSLNITWLQDANYAKTSGYDADGLMGWQQATNWTANLVYGGYDDWRLASARPIGNITHSFDGSTDYGYNNSRAEIGHIFIELGNKSQFDSNGSLQGTYGESLTSTTYTNGDQVINFYNIQSVYWERESSTSVSFAFVYDTRYGSQAYDQSKNYAYYAWAVRDGDVAAVPVPAAAWLFSTGLISLAGAARRKKSA